MFERYNEEARRTIFFARYEASTFRSTQIETEHLLLGLLREDKRLFAHLLPSTSYESVRKQLEARTRIEGRLEVPTSVDLPLDEQSKRALGFAAEEADRLNHRHIGTEHLLLGLLREEKSPGAKLLQEAGAKLPDLRLAVEKLAEGGKRPVKRYSIPARGYRSDIEETVEIHGSPWNAGYVRDAVARCREYSWYWHKRSWTPSDIVVDRKSGKVSFDLRLAEDTVNFELVKGGWKKDLCAICSWELFESSGDPSHGTGFTNGRDWLCAECYEKFFARPGFSSAAYGEIT